MDHGLEIDGFRVQRVEVIKGPAAIQYGSDATGGIINILPEPVPEKGLHATAAGLYKTNNKTRAGSLGLTYRKNQWYTVTRFSAQRYNDYHVPATEFTYNGFVLPISDNRLLNTGGKDWNLQALIGKRGAFGNTYFQVTHFNQLAGIFPGAIGIPRYNDLNYPEPDGELNLPMQSVQHTRLVGHVNRQLKNGWLEVDAGWQYNKRQELSPPHSHGYETLDPGDSLALQMLLQTYSLRATYHTHLANEIELTTGLNTQYQNNVVSGFEYLIPNYTALQAGAFVFARKELSKTFSVNMGLRADGATLSAIRHEQPWYKDPDSLVVRTPDIDRDFLNLAVAGGINYNPSNLLALKFNYSRTFRIPSIAELGANGVHHGTFRHEVGNPDLDPERAHQFDGGASITLPSWFIKANAFFNYFNNIIYLAASGRFSPLPDAGQLYIYSQDPAIHTGFEVYAEYHPIKMIHLESTSEYVHTYNLNSLTGLPFTPPFMQQFSITLSGGEENEWHTGLTWVLAATQNNTDRNEPPTPGYNLVHAHAGYTFMLRTMIVEISLIGRNLLNTAYLNNMSRYRILNLPEQGRNIVLQFGMRF